MVTSKPIDDAQKFTRYLFLSGNIRYVRQVYLCGIKKDRMEMLMSGGCRVRN